MTAERMGTCPPVTAMMAISQVVFPAPLYASVVEHGLRKLQGRWLPDEEQAPKAYGLVGGRVEGARVTVTHVLPLRNNLRNCPRVKPEVDGLMAALAVRSETPFERRGWVADPREVLAADRCCEEVGSVVFGSYHMHRVPWPHDPRRDSCTALDTAMAKGSGLWAFILSMVDPERPVLRGFFEGDNDREAHIRVEEAVQAW